MSIKQKLIKFLNPVRRLINNVYSFVLAAYLGKIMMILNEIDHNILDWIFYFFVYSPLGGDIKEFHRVVSSQTMGKKLNWLKEIHKGNLVAVNKEIKTLTMISTVSILVGNINIYKTIKLLEKLIDDTRNPLVHSNYFLGWGNEYEWKLSYKRFHFNKKKNDFENNSFTIREARDYLKAIKIDKDALMKLFANLLKETTP